MKKRLDQILVDNGLVESKTKAQALIMAGQVFAEGHRVDKAGTKLDESAQICVKELFPYVSRGALKLEKAHQEFGVDFEGKVICDIGSSTGGFTDCALKNGAKKVFAVDVGTGQLAQKIREDKRVIVMEKTDFRDVFFCHSREGGNLDPRNIFEDDKTKCITEPIDIFVCDVSFISLKKIIPKIRELTESFRPPCSVISTEAEKSLSNIPGMPSYPTRHSREDGNLDPRVKPEDDNSVEAILLIKPQFEAGVKEVSRGKGVIRDESLRQEIVNDITTFAKEEGFEIKGLTESPITGAKGNVEYLLYLGLS